MWNSMFSSLFSWFVKRYDLVLVLEGSALIVSFRKKPEARSISFTNNKGEVMGMVTLKDTEKVSVALVIKDAKGNPASVDGTPVPTSSDESVAAIANVSADGLSFDVVAGVPGVCQIQVVADADLGSGVKNITGFLDINVSAGEAVVVELVAGTPTEQ